MEPYSQNNIYNILNGQDVEAKKALLNIFKQSPIKPEPLQSLAEPTVQPEPMPEPIDSSMPVSSMGIPALKSGFELAPPSPVETPSILEEEPVEVAVPQRDLGLTKSQVLDKQAVSFMQDIENPLQKFMPKQPSSTMVHLKVYDDIINKYSQRYDVPQELIKAMIDAESRGDPGAVSPTGARGLMQLLPSTARDLGVDPDDPEQNIAGGVKYFRKLLNDFGGDTKKAASAYVSGPAVVKNATALSGKYGGNYVTHIPRVMWARKRALEETGSSKNWKQFEAQFKPELIGEKNKYFNQTEKYLAELNLRSPRFFKEGSPTLVSTKQFDFSSKNRPATVQPNTINVVRDEDTGILMSKEANDLVKNKLAERTPAQAPDYSELYKEALSTDIQSNLLQGLTKAGAQLSAALTGTEALDSGIKPTSAVSVLEGKLKLDERAKKQEYESILSDPNSSPSRLAWDMVKYVYPEIAEKLESSGMTNPSAKQLSDIGLDVDKLLTAKMSAESKAESLAQKERQQLRQDTEDASKSVDRLMSQFQKSQDLELYKGIKSSKILLANALRTRDKTAIGTAFMGYAKVAQLDNSVVREADMAQLAGNLKLTPEALIEKLNAIVRGANFTDEELENMVKVANVIEKIKREQLKASISPIVTRIKSNKLPINEYIDPTLLKDLEIDSSADNPTIKKAEETLDSIIPSSQPFKKPKLPQYQ